MFYCYKCGAKLPDEAAFCAACGNKVENPNAAPAAAPTPPPGASMAVPDVVAAPNAVLMPAQAAAPARAAAPVEDGNWFSRHLNWTWVLGMALCYGVQVGLVYAYAYIKASAPGFGGFTDAQVVWINATAWGISFLVVYVPVTMWVLLRKGWSLWFFFISFCLLPLWIPNKRQAG